MKIMFIANSSWNIVNFRSDLIMDLVSRGFKVQVLAPRDSYSRHISKMGCEYKELAISDRGINFLAEIKVLIRIFFYVRLLDPDIILSFTIKPNIYTGLIARFFKNVICSVTGLGSTFTNRMAFNFLISILYKLSLKKIKVCFFQNYDDMQYFLKKNLLLKVRPLLFLVLELTPRFLKKKHYAGKTKSSFLHLWEEFLKKKA